AAPSPTEFVPGPSAAWFHRPAFAPELLPFGDQLECHTISSRRRTRFVRTARRLAPWFDLPPRSPRSQWPKLPAPAGTETRLPLPLRRDRCFPARRSTARRERDPRDSPAHVSRER